jgi:hypothetical protein
VIIEKWSEKGLSGEVTEELHNRAFVLSLQDKSALSAQTAGAKAANLAKLIQAGYPVPHGIVVTTAAFADHYADLGAEEQAFSGTDGIRNRAARGCPYKTAGGRGFSLDCRLYEG